MTSPASRKPTTTLEERLTAAEGGLMMTVRRLYMLEAFHKELERVTKGKPFRIWGDIQWTLVLDSRDMLVIHLASWVKSVTARGGLLGVIRAHHIRELKATPPKGTRERSAVHHKAAFGRLFPSAKKAHAGVDDVDDLSARLRALASDLHKDRNKNRAHFFETAKNKGMAKMLDLTELRTFVSAMERMLNDIRIIAHDMTVLHSDRNASHCGDAAEELVHSILVGSSGRREVVLEGRDKQAYYADLHQRHDASQPGPDTLFNDIYDD
jgi:hypothetical protein